MAEKKLSPMMQQYLDTKKEYPDALLFYRIGDFYEMFYEDAVTASQVLDLVLTGKDCGAEERAPMCGVPFHAAEGYIARLVGKGYKVAIGEQVEDPKLAKGLVKREVIRVVTPGTLTSEAALEEGKNNFLMSVYCDARGFGISAVDISTGEFLTTSCAEGRAVYDELSRFSPSELLVNHAFLAAGFDPEELKNRFDLIITELPEEDYSEEKARELLEKHFHAGLAGLGLSDRKHARLSAAAALRYIYDTQKGSVDHIANIRYYQSSQFMIIDTATQRNLELCETMREKKKKGSLLWVLDKTKTAMGARLLRRYLEQPLIDEAEILRRQDFVEELCGRYIDREELAEYLNSIYDLERILGKISYQSANPRDLIAFKESLRLLPAIRQQLSGFQCALAASLYAELDELQDLYQLIDQAIVEDPPVSSKDGGVIKAGYHAEADRYRDSKLSGKQWLADLEAEEREKTGIKTLKIKYNRIFGYCIEVSNTFKNQVPDSYIRKQTLANGERYTTDRLEELQNIILGAEEKLNTLEYTLFAEVRDRIGENINRVQKSSHCIAVLDCMVSLSRVSTDNQYVRPKINNEGRIVIQDGRHPVIEQLLKEDRFVSNDTLLDDDENRIAIITGPNMAGKSTYMRQVALITLMASIGSFVPAKQADISICDRIFTRVGASDDLASGQSTFMVEMNEVANILRNATTRSLLILDEIGRGTSTFDGLSIAWAVVEYLSNTVKAKALFATHYHELTELEGKLEGVKNYCIAVTNHGQDIVFLRKILRGGADQSYGIDVARLAGVPQPVIDRAKEIAAELSEADILAKARQLTNAAGEERSGKGKAAEAAQTADRQGSASGVVEGADSMETSAAEHRLLNYMQALDLNRMTPLEAINCLYEMKELAAKQ